MDDRRFDQLARAISGAAESRRDTLKVVAGGAAAAVLGLFGIAKSDSETEAARDDKKNKNKNRRRRHRNNKKNTKICHCSDNSFNNCKTIKVSKSKANKHLKKHPQDRKGSCDKCLDFDNACNVNRPGQCCSNNCCFDSTSDSDGICPTDGGNCCGLTTTGGYCTTQFPQCCGEQACCQDNWVCCSNFRLPNGYCCPPGNTCDFNQPNGCIPNGNVADEANRSASVGSSEPRRRMNNR